MIEFLIYTSDDTRPVEIYAKDYREAIEKVVAQGHPLESLTGMSFRDALWIRGDSLLEKYRGQQETARASARPFSRWPAAARWVRRAAHVK